MESGESWRLQVKYFQMSITNVQAQHLLQNSNKDIIAQMSVMGEAMGKIRSKKPMLATPKFIKWPPSPFPTYEIKQQKRNYLIHFDFYLDQKLIANSQFQIPLKSAKIRNQKVNGNFIPFKFGQIEIQPQWKQDIHKRTKSPKVKGRSVTSNPSSQESSSFIPPSPQKQNDSGCFSFFGCIRKKPKPSKPQKPKFSEKQLRIHKVYKYELSEVKKMPKQDDRKRIVNEIAFMTKKEKINP